MKILIIYHSQHHSNTQKIAHVLAKELSADLKTPNDLQDIDVSQYDIIGLGSGIYAGRHHVSLIKLADSLVLKNKPVFIFSTRGLKPLLFYHKSLLQHLERNKCTVIGEFSAQGYSSYGPLKMIGGINKSKPDEEDFEKARQFAQTIKAFTPNA